MNTLTPKKLIQVLFASIDAGNDIGTIDVEPSCDLVKETIKLNALYLEAIGMQNLQCHETSQSDSFRLVKSPNATLASFGKDCIATTTAFDDRPFQFDAHDMDSALIGNST